MNSYRRTAIIVGVLFIIGTAAGILSGILTNPVPEAQDYLSAVTANENQVIIGALFILTMGLALAMIPIVLFPLLKKFNEVLALSYVVIRGALETVTYLAMVVCWLLIVSLTQKYAGTSSVSEVQDLIALLLQILDEINLILIIVFGLGALVLYYLLYTSKLIPRWISVWGILAILLNLSTSFLDMFGLMNASMFAGTLILNFPIFLQEMVMAIWLIVKGFNPSALASVSTKADKNQPIN